MAQLAFRRATRQAVKLKIGVQGPSGSGKTEGALHLARALAPNGKIALIDTEHGSASLYADRFTFDTLELEPPFTTKRYLEALNAAVDAGYEVVVIDSISHQWAGEGGILDRKGIKDSSPGSNSYTNWAPFTKEHEEFKARLLQADIHVIATVRSKQDYILETNDRGKSQPVKVGLAGVQREGMEYEFSIMFELQMDHKARVSKDRTNLFEGQAVDFREPAAGKAIVAWLASAEPAQPKPPTLTVVTQSATDEQRRFLASAADMSDIFTAKAAATLRAAAETEGLTHAKAVELIQQANERINAHAEKHAEKKRHEQGDPAVELNQMRSRLASLVEQPACASIRQLVVDALDKLDADQVEDYLTMAGDLIAKAAK